MTTILAGSAIALLLLLAALAGGEQKDDLRLLEFHHGWLGAGVVALGAWREWEGVALVGFFILAEDALQHAAQRWSSAGAKWRSGLWHFWQDVWDILT